MDHVEHFPCPTFHAYSLHHLYTLDCNVGHDFWCKMPSIITEVMKPFLFGTFFIRYKMHQQMYCLGMTNGMFQ